MPKKAIWIGLAVCAALGLTPAAGAAPSQPAPATVTLVHGVRGLVADVYVDNALALPSFQPERTTDPLTLPAGSHTVAVRTSGALASAAPLLEATIDLPAGARLSAVVHLKPDGSPTATLYSDDLSQLRAGAARVVVRHAAAAGAVDVLLDDQPLATALANATEIGAETTPGTHKVAVEANGALVTAPQDVPIVEGTMTALYLIGSAADGSVVWLAHRMSAAGGTPTAVATGSDGLARHYPFAVGWWLVPAALALLSALGLMVRWSR